MIRIKWKWQDPFFGKPKLTAIDDEVYQYVNEMPDHDVLAHIVGDGLDILFAKEEDALAFKLRFGCDTSFVR